MVASLLLVAAVGKEHDCTTVAAAVTAGTVAAGIVGDCPNTAVDVFDSVLILYFLFLKWSALDVKNNFLCLICSGFQFKLFHALFQLVLSYNLSCYIFPWENVSGNFVKCM
jgi:hypothetical protein